jgi:predicted nucleic acid-binding protein
MDFSLVGNAGARATINGALRRAMQGDGMSEDDIAEVSATLSLIQRQNVAADKPERLTEAVERLVGEPSPVNLTRDNARDAGWINRRRRRRPRPLGRSAA